jgi:hypothetical protein
MINELRIGNKIYYNGKVSTIDLMDFVLIKESDEEQLRYYKPIPLTEDILIKAGFERINNKYRFKKGWHWITIDNCSLYINDKQIVLIDYLHQLQNLYFALTGEELDIKL